MFVKWDVPSIKVTVVPILRHRAHKKFPRLCFLPPATKHKLERLLKTRRVIFRQRRKLKPCLKSVNHSVLGYHAYSFCRFLSHIILNLWSINRLSNRVFGIYRLKIIVISSTIYLLRRLIKDGILWDVKNLAKGFFVSFAWLQLFLRLIK